MPELPPSHADFATDPEALPADLRELGEAIDQLPENYRRALHPRWEAVVTSTRRRKKILGLVQDALSQLRLDMKYLLFDLDATRRERDDYRRQIEDA